jgi:hypothetical protein
VSRGKSRPDRQENLNPPKKKKDLIISREREKESAKGEVEIIQSPSKGGRLATGI